MMTIRPAAERGRADFGWLDTRYTFSFNRYYDERYLGFRALRVINEDVIQPGKGFGTHPHEEMEIITYLLSGALEHRDSMGSGGVLRPGDVQQMSAGTGLTHSEFNHSNEEEAHLLQIWLLPKVKGIQPNYAQQTFDRKQKLGRLCPIVSPDGRADSLKLNQDAVIYASILEASQILKHQLDENRHCWLQVARGALKLNGRQVEPGDGVALSDERNITLEATSETEFLLFDLA